MHLDIRGVVVTVVRHAHAVIKGWPLALSTCCLLACRLRVCFRYDSSGSGTPCSPLVCIHGKSMPALYAWSCGLYGHAIFVRVLFYAHNQQGTRAATTADGMPDLEGLEPSVLPTATRMSAARGRWCALNAQWWLLPRRPDTDTRCPRLHCSLCNWVVHPWGDWGTVDGGLLLQVPAAGYNGVDSFELSVWFRSPYDTADGSRIAVVSAPANCNDRSSGYVEIMHNAAGNGMDVRYYTHARDGNEGDTWQAPGDTWRGGYVHVDADTALRHGCRLVQRMTYSEARQWGAAVTRAHHVATAHDVYSSPRLSLANGVVLYTHTPINTAQGLVWRHCFAKPSCYMHMYELPPLRRQHT